MKRKSNVGILGQFDLAYTSSHTSHVKFSTMDSVPDQLRGVVTVINHSVPGPSTLSG